MLNFTLKTKVTMIFPAVITIVTAGIFFLMYSTFQFYVRKSISNQQYQTVSMLADDIDRSIIENQEALVIIAGRVTRQIAGNPQEALKYLQSQSEHLRFFNNGFYLFDKHGRIIADTALGLARTGQDYMFREYLKQAIDTPKPLISEPYQSAQSHHHPAITFTTPIFDKDGSLLAVLGGSIDLTNSSFIEKMSRISLTGGGYVYLFSKDRMLIYHTDKTRIMKRDVLPGINKLFDRATKGFEGTGETVTSQGLHTFSSFKHLKTNNWIVAANYPIAEAFAPVYKFRKIFLFTLPFLSLAVFWLMRRAMKRMADPVVELTRHVEGLQQKTGQERMFPVQGNDEISMLGKTFNTLVLENDQQREKLLKDLQQQEQIDSHLQRQNEYLQALHETTVGLISRHDVADLLQDIVIRAGKLVGTEDCFLYLKNTAGTEMDMLFQNGIYNSFIQHPIKPGQGLAGRVWNSGEPFRVDDYNCWEGRLPDPDRDQIHAVAGVPLKAGGEVVGILGVAFLEAGIVFDDDQMALLYRFGELASLALETARLTEESRRELAERRKAENHLRKLSVAVEQSPASIIITDTSGIIEYVNPHFTQLTGYLPDEVVGNNPSILKTGETSHDEYRLLWETILSGREWRGEFHNRKKSGELYWEQALIAPIRDDKGETTHFICIKEDITERKQLENQLRHAQKMEAIGQLAGGIAHDFNNILTAIIGYSSIIQLKLPNESPLTKNAEQIVATAERGAKLTQGLLAFSRKQATILHLIDLNEIIGRVQQLLLRLISEDIHLELTLAQYQLPVIADSVQIEQVLMNLATNARDAMPKGGTLTISTQSIVINNDFILAEGFGKQGNYALLTFADNGEGMDAEVSKHIFEPFYTTKEIGKGTGLGLSIVYGIIKKHNGYITCQSTPERGTSIRVYLPISPETSLPESIAPSIKIHVSRGGGVILVAEDDNATRQLTKEILEEFGYVVLEARDGQEALDLFKNNRDRINLVLLDVIMPNLNGREVFDAIRLLDPAMKVLFCSGYSEEVVIRQSGFENGLDYLAKPFSPKELLMKIREVLDNGKK